MEDALKYWQDQLKQYESDLNNEINIENFDISLKVLLEKSINKCKEEIKILSNG